MTSPKPSQQQPDTRLPSLRAADAILAKLDVSSPHRDPADIRRKLSAIIAEETNCNTSPDNAHLIAAAPEMFEALQSVVEMGDWIKGIMMLEKEPEAITKARAALAEAGGGKG